MNIFFLDICPFKAGRYHCDKHIVKMILEYGQMLSTTHRILDNNNHPKLYKKAFINHPSTKWVRQSWRHYVYLFDLWSECINEYRRRYNNIHKAEELYQVFSILPKNFSSEVWENPPQCMPDKYKKKFYVDAYREFYIKDKSRFAKWKIETPQWYLKGLQNEVA
jgi:hypothetical protein